MLQTETEKVGQPHEGYEAIGDGSPLTPPNRFLRTDVKLKAVAETDDMDVKLEVEEVTAGLRVSVVVRNAEPGRYRVVLHEWGYCGGKNELGPVLDLMAPKTLGSNGVQRSDWERALGDVYVKADGDGRARWLTSWGTLREDDKSILQRPLALYRTLSGDKLGEVAVCAPVTMD
jgi:hypothetical protein